MKQNLKVQIFTPIGDGLEFPKNSKKNKNKNKNKLPNTYLKCEKHAMLINILIFN